MALSSQFNYAQKRCLSNVGQILHKTAMLRPGCRVGVAVSGGMDSSVLLQTLLIRRRKIPFHFDIMALHINPGFARTNHVPFLDWLKRLGVSAHAEVTDIGPRAHTRENKKNSPCLYCSMLRRKALFELCRKYRLTHLAFGHNADDLVSTFFMNLFQGGKVSGMSAKQDFFGGNLEVVRPLLLARKEHIRSAARKWKIPVIENPCPSAESTNRAEVWEWLEEYTKGNRRRKNNLFNGLRRWQLDLDT
ncbi:MAG: tRNA lysidine(34) synthetase [Desulfovibrionales bacterium]